MPKFLLSPKFLIPLLILLNLAPLGAFYMDKLHVGSLALIYWSECALIGATALFFFATRLSVFVITAMAAFSILKFSDVSLPVDDKVHLTFWALYGLCWLIYIEITQSIHGLSLRRASPSQRLGLYIIMLGAALSASFGLTVFIYGLMPLVERLPTEFYMYFLAVAVTVPTISIGLLKIIGMVGPNHFVQFLSGTYHHPVERERIVLFLDMVGSSANAERLAPKEAMDLIARFIFDATAIFRIHGGDIVNYTGDGLVVLWPRKQADRALMSVIALRTQLDSSRHEYRKLYKIVPDFRIGIHSGTVVLQQIGEEKLFLGVYGDVVNTAARLEQMNKELGTKILLSDALLRDLSQNWQAQLEAMGHQSVRGKTEGITVYTINGQNRNTTAAAA
jgi:class 3 adenylate cyclase